MASRSSTRAASLNFNSRAVALPTGVKPTISVFRKRKWSLHTSVRGVIKRHQPALGVPGGDVAAFVPVTKSTAEAEVALVCLAPVFLADDMIHLASPKSVTFVDQAIFASPGGTDRDLAPERGGDVRLTHGLEAGGRGPWPAASGAPVACMPPVHAVPQATALKLFLAQSSQPPSFELSQKA